MSVVFLHLIRIERDIFDGRVSEETKRVLGKDRTPGRCVDGIQFPQGPKQDTDPGLSLSPPPNCIVETYRSDPWAGEAQGGVGRFRL